MSQFKKLILTLVVTLSPFIVAADNDKSVVTTYSAKKNDAQCVPKTRNFRLRDFAGEWTLNVQSIGGVAGEEALGYSFTSDGQLSINKQGTGVVNHYEGVIYAGVPGEIIHFSATPKSATLVLQITDPVIGVGIITITDPEFGGVVQVVDFVAIRSIETGQAIRLEGHGTSSSPTTQAIASYTLIRQNI